LARSAEREVRAGVGDRRDLDVFSCVTPKPGEIARRVPRQHEPVVVEPAHRDVGNDPAVLVEHHRVGDGAGGPADPSGDDPPDEFLRAFAPDLEACQRRHVEQPGAFSHGTVLSHGDRGPMARGPRIALRLPVHQARVGSVPLRALPGGDVDEGRVERALPLCHGGEPDPPCRHVRLDRVVRQVDVRVLVRRAGLEERRLELRLVESGQIRRCHIDRRVAAAEQIGDDLRDPDRVRHPHRLRDPEPIEVRVLADQRVAVWREPEDPVEPALEPRAAERRHEPARELPRLGEVLGREPEREAAMFVPRVHVERLRGHREHAMVERPDADPVAVVAVVDADVVVPDDRAHRLVSRCVGELGDG
jgi:hypothetical protein